MKPVCKYGSAGEVLEGRSATLFGVSGHPLLGSYRHIVYTSTVLSVDGEGRIETLNTIYVKASE